MENSKKVINYISIGIAIIFMILMLFDIGISITMKFLLFIGTELIVIVAASLIIKQQKDEKEKNESFKEGTYTVCSMCGTKNKKRQSYCSKCKSSIVIKVCPVCKEVNAHDAKYCKSCDSILQNVRKH